MRMQPSTDQRELIESVSGPVAEILPLEPVYAFKHLLTFLIVVSVAGFGNIKAVAVVSLILGVIDTAGRYFVPAYGAFVIYLTMIAILLWRPNGLFSKT